MLYSIYILFSDYYLNISETNLCPSSIAAWFYAHNYYVYLCHQTFSQRTKYSITIPTLQERCNLDKFFEWLGVFSMGGDLYVIICTLK